MPADADLSSVVVGGQWGSDNNGIDILINGVSTGQTNGGFVVMTSFDVTSDFVHGTNTLDFVFANAGAGPTGLRVDGITGVYFTNAIPEPTSLALASLGLLGLLGWRRRKR